MRVVAGFSLWSGMRNQVGLSVYASYKGDGTVSEIGERGWRKLLYFTLVGFVVWGFLLASAIAASYGQLEPGGILLMVGAILTLLGAITLWSARVGTRWRPSAKTARRIRQITSAAYLLFFLLALLFALPLGWQYFAAARPTAFALFRIANIGSILFLVVLCVLLNRWQVSLKALESDQT